MSGPLSESPVNENASGARASRRRGTLAAVAAIGAVVLVAVVVGGAISTRADRAGKFGSPVNSSTSASPTTSSVSATQAASNTAITSITVAQSATGVQVSWPATAGLSYTVTAMPSMGVRTTHLVTPTTSGTATDTLAELAAGTSYIFNVCDSTGPCTPTVTFTP
ncbi:MAG: hypothetical protein NTZ03_08890 [Actinobacteria bacterium]|nr:hypothetical protein [Actinomycetota bacterium]